MARKPKAGDHGHNSGEPLTDDELAALQHYYADKIRQQQRKADLAKAAYDLERTEVNGLFALVKGDLKYSRKEFEEVLAAQAKTEAEFRHDEAKRARRFTLHGLPVGTQIDMFSGDAADDAAEADANGYRAGRRADDPIPPTSLSTMFHQDWMRGWERGQGENLEQFAKANEIIAARAAKAVELQPEAPAAEDGREPEEVIADAARKLKREGWAEPTAAESELEAAAA